MITTDTPRGWKELQEEAGSILRECGFKVEVEKKVTTVRGEVEIDVYAEEAVKGRKYIILCECKHWASRVPQSVIHSFRTSVADIGANVGYVISTSGFQAGAYAASELTNLQLTNWGEFQAAFEESWFTDYFSKTLASRLTALLSYTDPSPLPPVWFSGLSEIDQDTFIALREKHQGLGHLVLFLSPYHQRRPDDPVQKLPLGEALRERDLLNNVPREIADARGYKQLFALLVRHGDARLGVVGVEALLRRVEGHDGPLERHVGVQPSALTIEADGGRRCRTCRIEEDEHLRSTLAVSPRSWEAPFGVSTTQPSLSPPVVWSLPREYAVLVDPITSHHSSCGTGECPEFGERGRSVGEGPAEEFEPTGKVFAASCPARTHTTSPTACAGLRSVSHEVLAAHGARSEAASSPVGRPDVHAR